MPPPPPPLQVFKAARALAPSVVLIEGVEGVMVTDRTRARAFAGASGEPPNRIKKQLVVEVRGAGGLCGWLAGGDGRPGREGGRN